MVDSISYPHLKVNCSKSVVSHQVVKKLKKGKLKFKFNFHSIFFLKFQFKSENFRFILKLET